MAKFQMCKMKRKNEEIKMKVWLLAFAGSIFLKFGVYTLGISAANLISIGLDITKLYRCENSVLFLPVNTHGVEC